MEMKIVYGKAPRNKPRGLMPFSPKESFRRLFPAGFGALAITVSPPPDTAPATRKYFASGVSEEMSVPK